MPTTTNRNLAPLTTMRVGGPAAKLIEATGSQGLLEALRAHEGDAGDLFVLGGGSNVLVCDEGFDGCVIHTVAPARPITVLESDDEGETLRVEAGTVWDDCVRYAVEHGLAGIEALSGIPGQIGSAVMQNLGAYGQEVGSALVAAEVYDRATRSVIILDKGDLHLTYRGSILRRSMEEGDEQGTRWHPSPRYIVLSATLRLKRNGVNSIEHPQLARALGLQVGDEQPIEAIRREIMGIRAGKAMVADPDPCGPDPHHDRWSSGSFFTNPIIKVTDAGKVPADAPRYPAGDEALVKLSAAWLIEHAGFPKGWGVNGPDSAATLSHMHTLALTNRGSADASQMIELARAVRDGVEETFGITLVPETVLIGCSI